VDLVRCEALAGQRTVGENGGGEVKEKSRSKVQSYKSKIKKVVNRGFFSSLVAGRS
jgi:hypothetical protein